MDEPSVKVLLVDDDEDDFVLTRDLLGQIPERPHRLDWVSSYDQALEVMTRDEHDIYLVDFRLGEHTGLDLIREATARACRKPMILLTGQGGRDVDLEAMRAGAADYLVKRQLDAATLERAIRYAMERDRAHEQIREQAALLDNAHEAILVRDLEGRIVYWNKGAERLYGWKAAEALGQPADALLTGKATQDRGRVDEARDLLAASLGISPLELLAKETPSALKARTDALLEHGAWVGEVAHVTKGGKAILVESRRSLLTDGWNRPKSILVLIIDITEKKKLEAQFLRAQRLESIGRLASGIAHDLNNVLGLILIALEYLKKEMPPEECHALVSDLQKSVRRGAEIVKQVLSFGRGLEGERILLQPSHILYDLRNVLRHTFPKTVELHVNAPADLWAVTGDATQLYQVLMNLCVNALDAMPGGGRLEITAANVTLDASYAAMHPRAKPGPYVLIQVADTGSGIPREILDKIFDPFFTTKETGKGTGLGLSTVLGIVEAHDGFVNVYSEVGKGTRFAIHLPAGEGALARAAAEPVALPAGHGELILVVDDEESFRQILKATLEAHGYRVVTARDGTEAVALAAEHRAALRAVVTDTRMPNLDGVALTRVLRHLAPAVRVIASSGLAANGQEAEARAAGASAFLPKPYTAPVLLQTLHELLGPTPTPQPPA